MTLEEHERTDSWSNEEYFNYMKESGRWDLHGNRQISGKPCERCSHKSSNVWEIEAYIDVEENGTRSYTVGTAFEICTICMLELNGSTNPI